MLEQQKQLYQQICAYELDDPSHEIGFLDHLIRANGWSRPFGLRAIEEYRKFVFLALVADHQVTPSDQVDQVWHLHLLFSEAYWNDFCPQVLGRPLHHHPAKGGQAERNRFHELYRATIRSYRQHFGEPPADLWPPVDVRFGRDLQMQRCRVRRPFRPWRGWRRSTLFSTLLASLGLLSCGIAKAAAGSVSDPPPVNVYLQGLLLCLLTTLVAWGSQRVGSAVSSMLLRPLVLQPSGLSATPQLDNEHLAYLSAGPTRVVELGLSWLVQQGVLRPNPSTRKLELMGQVDEAMPGIAHQVLRVYHQLATLGPAEVAYTDIATLSRYDFTSQQKSMQTLKSLLKGLPLRISEWALLSWLLIPCVLIFVLIRIDLFWIGPEPIVSHFLYLILTSFFLGLHIGLIQLSGHTLWGEAVLRHYQSDATHSDPLRRVALLGPTAMCGGRLDNLSCLIKKVEEHAAASVGCGGCGC